MAGLTVTGVFPDLCQLTIGTHCISRGFSSALALGVGHSPGHCHGAGSANKFLSGTSNLWQSLRT